MKLFLFAFALVSISLPHAYAGDTQVAKGMILLNNGVAVPKASVEALHVIAHQNFLIQEFEAELEGHHHGLELHKKIGFASSQWTEADYQKAIADTERKIADAKDLKIKMYGPDVDKAFGEYQEKLTRLGKMREQAEGGKNSAAIAKLESEVAELGKNLAEGQKKFVAQAAKLAKAAGRSKIARAGVVALPLAAAAAVVGGSSEQAEASELHEITQLNDSPSEDRGDVAISELGND